MNTKNAIAMKNIILKICGVVAIALCATSCKEDIAELGPPPSAEDLAFTITPSGESDNILTFSSSSKAFLKQWEFSNGERREGNTVVVTFPFAGTYTVTLRVFTSGGSLAATETIEIAETDLSLLKPIYTLLTGGNEATEGKTWVVDKTRPGHMGIGPIEGDSPSWWSAAPGDKDDTGLYDDRYTFQLQGLKFIMDNNGDVYVNTAQASNFPGSYENKGDYTAPFTPGDNLGWSISEDGDKQFLNINGNGFIGYFTGVRTSEIVEVSEEVLYLRYADAANSANAWYLRLIPDGFTPPPPPPPVTVTLPIDFEGAVPPFEGFGGTVYEVVDNPDADALNGSAKVGKYAKGGESWAGIAAQLSMPLDFSEKTVFKYHVYSPVTGRALFKIENSSDAGQFVEVFADITQTGQWEELSFDFSTAASGVYDKIAIFLDFDNNNGGTFYIDNIRLEATPSALAEADLTGGSSKTWRLKAGPGAFGVGPAKGAMDWWPGGDDISDDRPCLFNDQYTFSSGGVYTYNANGDLWAEAYMGVTPDGCIAEGDVPADAAAWTSGIHAFEFTPAVGDDPAYVTVTGTGAFIALPKAYNGGEYTAGPPVENASVTYEVLQYVKTPAGETLTLTLDIGGGVFWTFVLQAE
jgi:PKD repeat protein